MCGIVGMVAAGNSQPDRAVLARMAECLRHRGPDGYGEYVNGSVGLAMRRLAIIDLVTGLQPMSNEDKTVWTIFNGEIYNFIALRKRLEERGHRFTSQSDTETIVHAYEEFGTDFVTHLRGMFAIALWDSKCQTLLLARDPLGKKPLLYCQGNGVLVFASEFAALLEHPAVSRDVSPAAIDMYLSLMYVPAPLTAYASIHKLAPGHILQWKNGDISIRSYWNLDYREKTPDSEEEAAERIMGLLREAVRVRMIADVPLGAFLSGGIDSSTVVALMAEQSRGPVKTFSVGFEEQTFSELRHARRIARMFGTEHHEFVVRPDVLDVLPLLIDRYGEPYADSSAIPTYYVARETRRHVTVALNGDGGDEDFGGYSRYVAMSVASRYAALPRAVRAMIEQAARRFPWRAANRNFAADLRRFLASASASPLDRYVGWVTAIPEAWKDSLYTPDFRAVTRPGAVTELFRPYFSVESIDEVDAALWADTEVYLTNDLLVKADIATMAASVEARSPFLDEDVIKFAAQLPSKYKVRRLTTKYLLRKYVLPGLVPRENVQRKKMGFVLPIGRWLRSTLRPFLFENLLSERACARGLFRPAVVSRIVREHCEGRRDFSRQLWTLLMLEMWFRRFIDHE